MQRKRFRANIMLMSVRKRKSDFRLTVSHFKILETIDELNQQHDYPTAKGVNNILSGSFDPETKKFVHLSTFGTLLSFPGRKLCSYILNMVRRGYITYVYDEKSDAMYLKITDKGQAELFTFNKRHKSSFKKKTPTIHAEVAHIE